MLSRGRKTRIRLLLSSISLSLFALLTFGCGASNEGASYSENYNSTEKLEYKPLGESNNNLVPETLQKEVVLSKDLTKLNPVLIAENKQYNLVQTVRSEDSNGTKIQYPAGLSFLFIKNESNGQLVGVVNTLTDKIYVDPDTIAASLIMLRISPILLPEGFNSDTFSKFNTLLNSMQSFIEFRNYIQTALDTKGYINLSDKEFESLWNKCTNDILEIFKIETRTAVMSSFPPKSPSITLSPNETYRFFVMLRIHPETLKATPYKDDFGNTVYSIRVDAFNSNIVFQELASVAPKHNARFNFMIFPEKPSDFVITDPQKAINYLKDLIHLNLLNSTWDSYKTPGIAYVSCKYNYLCTYTTKLSIISSFIYLIVRLPMVISPHEFSNFIQYLSKKPELITSLYQLIADDRYKEAGDIIIKEFSTWATGKISDFVISQVINSWNEYKRALDIALSIEDILSQIMGTLLAKFSTSPKAHACWEIRGLPCQNNNSDLENLTNQEEIPQDYSSLISGKVIAESIPPSLKIRITPDIEQIDGEWGGIVCAINPDGSFGDKCVLHGNIENFTQHHQYQIIVFEDKNNDWHYNKDEQAIFSIENANFGAWKSIAINNNTQIEESTSQPFSAKPLDLEYIRNKKIIFNEGKSYVILLDNGRFELNDTEDSGDGTWTYDASSKSIVLWPRTEYEYRIWINDSIPHPGDKMKISRLGGKIIKYSLIVSVVDSPPEGGTTISGAGIVIIDDNNSISSGSDIN